MFYQHLLFKNNSHFFFQFHFFIYTEIYVYLDDGQYVGFVIFYVEW